MTLTSSYWPADVSEPVLDTTVGGVLRDTAAQMPEATALVTVGANDDERRSCTYAELLAESERAARALLRHFEPGERLAVWANNTPEWPVLEFGAGLAGLVLVTVNPGYRPRELAYVLKQSRAAGLFYVRGFRGNPMAESVAAVRTELPDLRETFDFAHWDEFLASAEDSTKLPDVRPDDPVQIQYTSGTTGFPKGALLHHRGLTNNARLIMRRFDFREGDVLAHAMPFFHTAGCAVCALGAVQGGGTHAFLPAFEPGRLLDLFQRERATHTLAVPTMLIAMLEHPALPELDLSALRAVLSGGASVPAELVRAVEPRLGVGFTIIFGQTESSPVITMTRLDDSPYDKTETVGQALPQTEVKVVDPASGETVPVGATGELCTRGYLVMHEYFDKPEATAAALDADGWLHTGDLGAMDARGYCTVRGRLKEMVIRGGENLFPAEIEAVLHEHPEVGDVAVIGVPDAKMGEELAAFVRPVDGKVPEMAVLQTHVRAQLAAQKTPRYWIFVEEFPLTGSGKVQNFVLRERWEGGEFSGRVLDRKPVSG